MKQLYSTTVLTVWRNVLNVAIIMYTTFFCRYKKIQNYGSAYISQTRRLWAKKRTFTHYQNRIHFITGLWIVQIVWNANLPLHGTHLILHQDPLLSHSLFENHHRLFPLSLYHALYLFHGYHLCFVQTVDASYKKRKTNCNS